MTRELKDFLASLNPVQRDAVLHYGNPLLILAGAGSGKTRVIIGKIAYLIQEKGIDPQSILAVTFTNKAAEEMRERTAALVPRASEVMIRTFHSFGSWFLRRNSHLLDLNSRFTIYDDDDQLALLASLFPEMDRQRLRLFTQMISRAKDHGLGPEDDLDPIGGDAGLSEVYQSYEKRLQEIGNVDFGDLILRSTALLEGDDTVKNRVQNRFPVILVDEYQDSNIAQDRLLRALCGPQSYICVVGDDDQSIYRFRGAEIANILEFSTQFPGTDTIRLEQNYRSSGNILALASEVVRNNSGRLGKELWTENPAGSLPAASLFEDGEAEAEAVCSYLRRLRAAGQSLNETAILYRTNAQSRLFETKLLHAEIPYRIVGTLRFYEREEIKDALAFLKFISNPKDEVSFNRIINKPARGLGPVSVQKILLRKAESRNDISLALDYALGDLSGKARKSAEEFLALYRRLAIPEQGQQIQNQGSTLEDKGGTRGKKKGSEDLRLSTWVKKVIEDSGLLEYHSQQDKVAGSQKVQNLEELVNSASQFLYSLDGLAEFLELIELDSSIREESETGEAVTLITMHNTKGLEFDRVICSGMEEGLFPRNGDNEAEVEEERRLFYVASTRARTELYFTVCARRLLHGQFRDCLPSRFLSEIPRELLTWASELGGLDIYDSGFMDAGHMEPYQGRIFSRPGLNLPPAYIAGTPRQADGRKLDYPRGTRVYHEDYGTGEVIKAEYNGSEEVVIVMFETGRSATFLPKYNLLEKID